MDGPWVINHPLPWLAEGDVNYAMSRLGYLTDIITIDDQRQTYGPYHDRILIAPHRMRNDMYLATFTGDHEDVRYTSELYHGPAASRPYTHYRIADLPPPPPDVMAEAIAFSQRRGRPPGAAQPPTRLHLALDNLKQVRHLWPTMQ